MKLLLIIFVVSLSFSGCCYFAPCNPGDHQDFCSEDTCGEGGTCNEKDEGYGSGAQHVSTCECNRPVPV